MVPRILKVLALWRPEKDRFFYDLVTQAPMGIFVQVSGSFAFLNPMACKILGASNPEVLVGTQVLDRFHAEDHDLVDTRIQPIEAAHEKVEAVEQAVMRLDGEVAYANTSAIPFTYDGEEGALVFLKDVTQCKQDREQRGVSDEMLRRAGALAKVGCWAFDPATGLGTSTEEVARIFDLDPAQPIDVATSLGYYTSASRPLIEAAIARSLKCAEPYDLELLSPDTSK